jgi:hypothetical protein
MGQILQNLQTLTHDAVALFAFDVGDETNTARVMFMSRII